MQKKMMTIAQKSYIISLWELGYTAPKIKDMLEEKYQQKITERTLYRILKEIKNGGVEIDPNVKMQEKTEAVLMAEETFSRGFIDKELVKVADGLSSARKNQTLISLSDLVRYSLAIKKRILEKVDNKLNNEEMTPLDASKVISNLGLNAINVAKMLGVQVDGTQNIQMKAEGVDEKGEDNQVKFYLPDNNR